MGNPGARVSPGIEQIRFEGRNGNVKAGPGSQTGLGLRSLTRKRVLVPLISLMLLLVVLIFGIGWYFSGVLNYEGLVIREDEREFDLIASVVGEGQIRLEQGPDGGEWTWPGKWGIVWDGGNGMVGDITVEANDSIVRRFTLAAGDPPQSSPATLLSDVYPADPLLYLGIDYESSTKRLWEDRMRGGSKEAVARGRSSFTASGMALKKAYQCSPSCTNLPCRRC